jgi:tetraacyldisaccharide 4'-kinase
MVAAIATEAAARGLSAAILSRGYLGQVRRKHRPVILSAEAEAEGDADLAWNRAICVDSESQSRPVLACDYGDEPLWLAARCGAAIVAVHPNRSMAAAVAMEHSDVDLFILDDGFQTVVHRDIDLVLLDPERDPPFSRRVACREGASSLARAHQLALVPQDAITTLGAGLGDLPVLRRRAESVRDFHTGLPLAVDQIPPVVVAAAVGTPASVASCAREFGVTVLETLRIRDHGDPSSAQLHRLSSLKDAAVLVTEKDAVGWAGRMPGLGGVQLLVLSMTLEGSKPLASSLLDRLLFGGLDD